jgi:pyridoxamine 5'-phosphate oxidase
MDISQIRKDYTKKKLNQRNISKDPVAQFKLWLREAIDSDCNEPTAMAISTVSAENRPSSRMVLLKGVRDGAFVFYSNYQSRKGQHLLANQHIAAVFHWPELERQVNIEGWAEKCTDKESDNYFNSRPWKSRIGAIISPQSQEIKNRDFIKKAFVIEAAKHLPNKVPRPKYWGGYSIIPDRIEFWQGRSSRLHDRFLFTRSAENGWQIQRLAP